MTISRTAAIATLVTAAAILACGVMAASPTSLRVQPSASGTVVAVHQLPRVVVTGHVQRSQTAQIVELPRVVVTGRLVGVAPTLVTQEEAATAALRS